MSRFSRAMKSMLVLSLALSIIPYKNTSIKADDYIGSGTGNVGGQTGGLMNFNIMDQGYRIYIIDTDGNVASRVVDLVAGNAPEINLNSRDYSYYTKFGAPKSENGTLMYTRYKMDAFLQQIGESGLIPLPTIYQNGAFYANGKALKEWMLGDFTWDVPTYTPPIWTPGTGSSNGGGTSSGIQKPNNGQDTVKFYYQHIDSILAPVVKQASNELWDGSKLRKELNDTLYKQFGRKELNKLLGDNVITQAEYNKILQYMTSTINNKVKTQEILIQNRNPKGLVSNYNGMNIQDFEGITFSFKDTTGGNEVINLKKILNYKDAGKALFEYEYDGKISENPFDELRYSNYKVCIEPLIWLQPTRPTSTGGACVAGEIPGIVPTYNGKIIQGCKYSKHVYGTVTNLMQWLSSYSSLGYSINNGTVLNELGHGLYLSPVAVQSLFLDDDLYSTDIKTGQKKQLMEKIPVEETRHTPNQLGLVLDKSNTNYPSYRYGYALHVYGPNNNQVPAHSTHTWDTETQECITTPCKAPVPPTQPFPDGEGPKIPDPNTGEEVKTPDYKFNIVKYYEDRHEDLDGNIESIDRSNHIRENNPPSIHVEDEDVYKLEDWYTSLEYHKPTDPNEDYYSTKSELEKNQYGDTEQLVNMTPDYETTLYLLLVKQDKPVEQEENEHEGDLVIEESQITKAISTEDSWLGKLNFTFNRVAFPNGCHTHGVIIPIPCCTYIDDSTHTYLVENTAEVDKKVQAEIGGKFDVIYHNNTEQGTSGLSEVTNSLRDVYRESVIWRGNDELTLNKYIQTGKESEVNELINRYSNTPQSERAQNGWPTLNLHLIFDRVLGEYVNSYSYENCDRGGSAEHLLENKEESNSKVTVKVYRGDRALKSIGDQHILSELNTAMNIVGNTTYHASGKQVQLEPNFVFYPYIRMTYQTTGQYGADRTEVNVLSQHQSTIEPNSFAEAGWYNPNEESSLRVTSQQWSLHTRAVEAYGKNNVLPGGAIHSLDIPEENQSKVALATWQPIMVGGEKQALTIGTGDEYTVAKAESEHKKFVDTAIKVLENWNLVQWVNKNPEASKAWSSGGMKVYGTGESLSSLGLSSTTSTEDKYYMKKGTTSEAANEADLDIIRNDKSTMYYKIFADTKGSVYLTSSNNLSELESIHEAGQGNSELLFNKTMKWQDVNSNLSGLAKEIDDRTQAITNLVKALERNTGNDETASWAKNDGKWYNEAFAVYMVRQCNTLTVGFSTPAKRTSALDPRLTPTNLGQSDLFSKFFLTQYRMDNKSDASEASGKGDGYISTFRGTDIKLKDAESMYQSRKFWIPNVNVQDLH